MGNEQSQAGPKGDQDALDKEKLRSIQRMDATLRRKLRGGVNYNMKIVLRGERGTGKTALMNRLQGRPFVSEYHPTPEIQTATINWSFKNAEDGIKVEVWDVVDKGIKVKPGQVPRLPGDAADVVGEDDAPAGLPLSIPVPTASSARSSAFGVLDASMVDVYKGCQAAIFLVNPQSGARAMQYLRKELPLVPESIPILILMNFKDKVVEHAEQQPQPSLVAKETAPPSPPRPGPATTKSPVASPKVKGESETQPVVVGEEGVKEGPAPELSGPVGTVDKACDMVTIEELEAFAREHVPARLVHVFECSMANCFGLKVLYSYLSIPFLAMKAEMLRRQLEEAMGELGHAQEEMGVLARQESYANYIEQLRKKRQARAAAISSPANASSSSSAITGAHAASPLTSHGVMGAAKGVKLDTALGGQHSVPAPGASVADKPPVAPDPPAEHLAVGELSKEERRERRAKKKASKDKEKEKEKAVKVPGPKQKTLAALSAVIEPVNISDVNEFAYRPSGGAADELDDFFADDGGEDDEAEARRKEDLARIAACMKPQAVEKQTQKTRGRRGPATLHDDDDDDDEPFVYVGLAPVNLSFASSSSSATSPPRAPPAPAPVHLPKAPSPPARVASPPASRQEEEKGKDKSAALQQPPAIADKALVAAPAPATTQRPHSPVLVRAEDDAVVNPNSSHTVEAAVPAMADPVVEGVVAPSLPEPERNTQVPSLAAPVLPASKAPPRGEDEDEAEDLEDFAVPGEVRFDDDDDDDDRPAGFGAAPIGRAPVGPSSFGDDLGVVERPGVLDDFFDDSDAENDSSKVASSLNASPVKPQAAAGGMVSSPTSKVQHMASSSSSSAARPSGGLSEAARAAIALTMQNLEGEVGQLTGEHERTTSSSRHHKKKKDKVKDGEGKERSRRKSPSKKSSRTRGEERGHDQEAEASGPADL